MVTSLRGMRGQCPSFARGTARSGLLMAVLAIAAYLGLSALLTVVHALSDVTISSTGKLPAGLTIFSAYACGFALWGLLNAFPSVERALARLPQRALMAALLIPMLALLASGSNWRNTMTNAANGSMLHLGLQLQERYDTLQVMGDAAQPKDAPPRFGLLGEIYRPGARKRAIDKNLPLPVVQRSIPATVFPVQMDEALPAQPETWPNLWAAWMLGLGGVYSAPPVATAAVAALEAPADMAAQKPVKLGLPQPLHDAGIDAAWLVRANGAPTNAHPTAATTTFSDLWLVLHGQDISKIERIAVLRLNKTDWRRLMPVFLQRLAASHLLERQMLADSAAGGSAYQQILITLAGEQIHFMAEGWKVGEYLAVPVSPAVNVPLGLFVSLNNGPMLRLDLSKP